MNERSRRAALAATAGLLFFLSGADSSARAGGAAVRARDDVTCALRAAAGLPVTAGATVRLKLVLRNRGRRTSNDLTMAVYADAIGGTPLWSEVATVKRRRRVVRRLDVPVPQTAQRLVAVAVCEVDDNPGNNIAGVLVVGGTPADPGGEPPPPAVDPAILAGAATYSASCAVCHGADAKGTSAGPNLLHRSEGDLFEAMVAGPGEMPTFPDLTRTDASNLSRFLADPSAATPPAPPPDPVPDPTPPTYSGRIKALFDASCVPCHAGSTAPKKIRLDTYANASANAAAALSAMQAWTMPPSTPAGVPEIELVSDWIDAGKPQ